MIPRDRELTAAQQSGLDPGWFQHEMYERTKHCDFPALVTTWTDGDNGGWFRTIHINSGFWGFFYHIILNRYRDGTLGFIPIHINDFLNMFPPEEEVDVHKGAWNTGHHWGGDFVQWSGSLLQKRGLEELWKCSAHYHTVKSIFDQKHNELSNPAEIRQLIHSGYDHILVAETSCNFYWGSAWVNRAFDDLEKAYTLLDTAITQMK